MHLDPMLPEIMKVLAVIVGLSLLVRKFKQPGPIAYILAGICLGPSLLGVESDIIVMSRIGSFGVIFLLFFVGQEISVKQITGNWKVAVIGTLAQILVSVGIVYLLGMFLAWNWQRSILIGFAVSLSSTAVAINILEEKKLLQSNVGKDVVTVLISQDLAIVPMLIILGAIAEKNDTIHVNPWLQLLGGFVLVASIVIARIAVKKGIKVLQFIKGDPELQFFVPLLICLLFSFITGYFEISTALGAFIAGIITSSLGEKEWFHKNLEPFKILFVGLFFVSVGMMMEVKFIWSNIGIIGTLTFLAFSINTIVNAVMFRSLGRPLGVSFYGGALLGQIGEFGFILAAIGHQLNIINTYAYQLIMSVTGITLFLTPAWAVMIERSQGLFKKKVIPQMAES